MSAYAKKHLNSIAVFILLTMPTLSQSNDGLYRWELGLGAAYISHPDYSGSNEQQSLWLPLPYFVYRSDSLLIDNSQITKSLFDSERLELDFSIIGGMPVASEDNYKRDGMDDLDAYVGIGPSINYRLLKDGENELKLELPIHAIVAASMNGIHQEGWQFEPGVFYYFNKKLNSNHKLGITTGASLQYADARFHNYLYGVSSKDAVPERPYFESKSGFSGVNYKLGVDWYFDDFKLGAFWRGTDIGKSVYNESPLVDTTFSHSFGFFLSWRFLKSRDAVVVLD